jgi:hypothetical protein
MHADQAQTTIDAEHEGLLAGVYRGSVELSPAPSTLEIEAFLKLIAAISKRLLTQPDAPIVI